MNAAITGRRGRHRKSPIIKGMICENCHKSDCIHFEFEAEYFHYFFIPIYITEIDRKLYCHNWNKTLRKKELKDEMTKITYSELKSIYGKVPFWYYIGYFLLISFIVAAIIASILRSN
jgi:hypothetical protein